MAAPEIRRILLLLAGGGFVSGLSIRLAEPLLPKVAHDFGVSVAAASVLITGFTLAYGLFQLVHGPLGDRIGKLRAVVGALVLAATTSAACTFAPSLDWLAALRFLTGMTAGAVIPLSFAFIGDNVPYEHRQTVLAQFITGTLMGQTLGPLIGGILSDSIGWRATFLIPACAFPRHRCADWPRVAQRRAKAAPRRVLQPGHSAYRAAETAARAHGSGGRGDRGFPVLRSVCLSRCVSAPPVRPQLHGDRIRAGRVRARRDRLQHAGAHAGAAPGATRDGGGRRGRPAGLLCGHRR